MGDFTNFSVRLDRRTYRALARLARHAQRKRGDFLRWLVRREATRRGLLPADNGAGEPAAQRQPGGEVEYEQTA